MSIVYHPFTPLSQPIQRSATTPTQQADEGLADLSPAGSVFWRGHQHGLGRAGAIQVGPAVGEGDAVVRAVDDQSVVLIACSPELLQDQADACRGMERPLLRNVLLCVCVCTVTHLDRACSQWCTERPSQREPQVCREQMEGPEQQKSRGEGTPSGLILFMMF